VIYTKEQVSCILRSNTPIWSIKKITHLVDLFFFMIQETDEVAREETIKQLKEPKNGKA